MLYLLEGILIAIGKMFILGKMGEERWKGLIPVYSEYLLFKHCWNLRMLGVFAGTLMGLFLGSKIAMAVSDSVSFTQIEPSFFLYAILMLACLALSIAALVIFIMFLYKLAKCFGHGGGYTAGLFFLPFVFSLILGFNDDQYQGVF